MNTGPIDEDYNPYSPQSRSTGNDDESSNRGNISKIVIDLGKSVNAVVLCAAICGICMAITVMTVWHSEAREVETQAQIRVLKNHIDDAFNSLARLEKDHDKR